MNRFVLILLASMVLATSAFASSTTCPLPNSPYANYLGGFSCVSGNLMFSDFTYSSTPGSPTAAQVIVTPLLTTGNEGFRFNANWSGNMDSLLVFSVTALQGAITDLHLTFNGNSQGAGSSANVSETVCLGGLLSTCGTPGSPGTPAQLFVPNSNSPISDAIFFAGVHSVQVSKDISVFAAPNGIASISLVDNTFSQNTPEPLSLVLLGSGLLGLGLMRKRIKR